MNRSKLILFSIIGLLLVLVIIVFSTAGKKEDKTFSEVDLKTENDTKFTYKDMMVNEEGNLFDGTENKGKGNIYKDQEKSFDDLLTKLNTSENDSTKTEEIYSNENQAIVERIEKEIKVMHTTNKAISSSNQANEVATHSEPGKTIESESKIAQVKQLNQTPQSSTNNNVQSSEPKRRSDKYKAEQNNNVKATDIIEGVIDNGNKGVKNGSTIRIRITKACTIEGQSIAKNTLISGIATLNEERLNISVKELYSKGQFIKCDLNVYDIDGLKGIYVSGRSLSRDVKTDAANEAVADADRYVEIPMIGRVGTNIIKRKIADQSIILNDNYQVSLRTN